MQVTASLIPRVTGWLSEPVIRVSSWFPPHLRFVPVRWPKRLVCGGSTGREGVSLRARGARGAGEWREGAGRSEDAGGGTQRREGGNAAEDLAASWGRKYSPGVTGLVSGWSALTGLWGGDAPPSGSSLAALPWVRWQGCYYYCCPLLWFLTEAQRGLVVPPEATVTERHALFF